MSQELTPRDIAVAEYAKEFGTLEAYLGRGLRYNCSLDDKEGRALKRKFIKQLREMRERIFRTCYGCSRLHFVGKDYACGLDNDYMSWSPENACTCLHYKERREA